MAQLKEAYAGGATSPPKPAVRPLEVPLTWRIGQGIVTLLVIAAALYFNFRGWKSGMDAPPTPIDWVGFVVIAGLIWLSTPPVLVIARTTWHEALRRRWMLGLLAFGVVALISLMAAQKVTAGEETRSFQDFGTGFIIAMTLLIAIFLGVSLVPPEIERRTIFTILAKPVNRMEFLLGKFFGLCFTLLMNLLILSAVFLTCYTIFSLRRYGMQGAFVASADRAGLGFDLTNISAALALHYGQLVVMAALALTMSLIVSHITAVVFCFIAYFGGQMSSYWQNLSKTHGATEGGAGLSRSMQQVLDIMYYALPRLDKFDVRNKLVTDSPVTMGYVWRAWDSGLIYVAVLLTVGYLVFSDREF